MRLTTTRLGGACALLMVLCTGAIAQSAPPASAPAVADVAEATRAADSVQDPFLWLEDSDSPRALDWVRAQNARSADVLEKDSRYESLYRGALKSLDSADRIPVPIFFGGRIYNLWQDQHHAQGLWRRTSLEDYRTKSPAWETVLDLDALSRTEGKTWVLDGVFCLQPSERRCLLQLSNRGEDAVEVREFDVRAKTFVRSGFRLPRGKQGVAWVSDNEIVVARDWGPGTMTASGYPFVLKTLRRGESLSAAKEVFRGKPTDMRVEAHNFYDGETGALAVLLVRRPTYWEFETYVLTPSGVVKLPLPPKSLVWGLVGGQLIFTLAQDWTPAPGRTFSQGALMAAPLGELKKGAASSAVALMTPGPRESIDQVAISRSRVLVAAYENVKGRGLVFSRGPDGHWNKRTLELPDNAAVNLISADDGSDRAFIQVQNFLQPPTLYSTDISRPAAPVPVKSLPAEFDASEDLIEQFEATSKDGTKVPYFVVRPKDLKLDGTAPTLLYAYGGFQSSVTPSYLIEIGKLWLERGGVYVVANIRGGGEFGPAWHEAALKTHRQRAFDDFAAVAQDLIARKITSPRRLGIWGSSNGGLLMGVEFEQHPELWNAVEMAVPLLDMLRYTKIGAGASWVGEYGSPDVPEEQAFLASISPYQNLKAGVRYPEPFFFASTTDDRVAPAHARKMAAKMQAMGLPFLYYEQIDGGHSGGANPEEVAHTGALELTYMTRKLMD